jgi:hypothetical protein
VVEWFNELGNPTVVQAVSATVQAASALATLILAVILVRLASGYARSTAIISAETQAVAGATRELAGEAREQRRDAAMPVLVLRAEGQYEGEPASTRLLRLWVQNQGAGPALNVGAALEPGRLRFQSKSPARPFTLGVGMSLRLTFTLAETLPYDGLERGEIVARATVAYQDVYGRLFSSAVLLKTGDRVAGTSVNLVEAGALHFEPLDPADHAHQQNGAVEPVTETEQDHVASAAQSEN